MVIFVPFASWSGRWATYKSSTRTLLLLNSFPFPPPVSLFAVASASRARSLSLLNHIFLSPHLKVNSSQLLTLKKMQFFALAAAVLPILAVNAVDIPIKVGDGGLVFNPSNVTANVGDNLQFQFVGGNHTATQSTFANPCQQMAGGITSGFMNVTAGAATIPQWTVTVNDTSAPLWFYCQQTTPKNHCQSGMVFAVNPTAEKSFAAFQQAAMNGASNSTASGSGSAGAGPTGTGSGSSVPSGTGSGSTSSATTSQSAGAKNNSGVKVAGGAASLMAVVGLVAGLAL